MEPSKPILLIALLAAAVPAWAQNSTSPGEQAAANSTEQAAASGSVDTSKLILARNPDEAMANPDAGLEPVAPPLSSALAGELAVDAPRYELPPSAAGAASADKAKNEIPRLPESTLSRFVVHGSRVNGFSDHDMLTDDGLVDLSFREHPGLRVGNLLNLNAPAAFEAFKEEERLSKMADLNDTSMAMAAGNDPAEAKLIQAEAAEAFMRTQAQEGPVGIR
jgi:hypothetical protein